MSRRRRPYPGLPQEPHLIKVWCTDRGRHQPRLAGVLGEHREPDVIKLQDHVRHGRSAVILTESGAVPHAAALGLPGAPPPTRPDGGYTFTFPCPRCGRAPQIRDDRLAAIVARWREAGRPRLDVSYWD